MRKLSRFIAPLGIAALSLVSSRAFAQSPPAIGAAAPPPDAKALVAGPKGPADAPKIEAPKTDETNVNVSAGGLITTGNSKTVALTMNGLFDMRRGNNGLLIGLIGNYGESTIAPATEGKATAQNLQGKLRYDRYVLDNLSGFLIATGRHDKFQGIAFRLNLDPGVKLIAYKDEAQAFWAEAGYDFQFDARNDAGRAPTPPATELLAATRTDHSGRAFVGYRRNFNSAVTFSTGLELLQSFVKTDLGSADTRVNFDANVAAKLDFGFSLGVGFNARYDRLPIPGRNQLDTSTTLSLIYAWSDAAPKKKEEPPPCPECPSCATKEPAPAQAPAPAPEAPKAPETAPAPATPTTPAAPTPPAPTPAPSDAPKP